MREALPDGPATTPGQVVFLPMTEMQRLAATLALDDGDLPTARAWLAAHDRWLAWNGTVLGRAEGQLGWAAYHRATGDLATARDHAAQALAHASAPRQPLALLAAHRLLGELATAAGDHDAAARISPMPSRWRTPALPPTSGRWACWAWPSYRSLPARARKRGRHSSPRILPLKRSARSRCWRGRTNLALGSRKREGVSRLTPRTRG